MQKSSQYISQRNLKRFEPGEIIFSEGETGKEMYIIKSGLVEVIKSIEDDEVVLAKLKEGDFFGEMAIIGDTKRTATIKAIEVTDTIVINEIILKSQFRKLPDWFGSMFKVLVKRIRDMDRKIKSRFKMGIQFSVLNIIYLVMEKYGTIEDQKFIINKEFIIEKIHAIIGISKREIIKLLSELKFFHLIEIDERESKIWIPDRDRIEKFLNFVIIKTFLKPGEKIESKLTDIDEKTLQYFNQLYKLITRSKESILAV